MNMLDEFNAFLAEPVKPNALSGFAVAAIGMRDELQAGLAALEAELQIAEDSRQSWKSESQNAYILREQAEAALHLSQASLNKTEAELAKWQQAVGLASTAVSEMEIDTTDPIGMMERVVSELVSAQAKDREHYESWKKDMAAWKVDRDRAEKAEAELAAAQEAENQKLHVEVMRRTEDHADQCKRAEQAEAEAETLRKMLRQTYTDHDMTWVTGDDFETSFESWLADLRTRADKREDGK